MKNILAENMLRFGTKNISEADIRTKITEQLEPNNDVTLYKSVAWWLNEAMKEIDKKFPNKYNAAKKLKFDFKSEVKYSAHKPDVEVFGTGKQKSVKTIDYILTLNGQDLPGTDNTLAYLVRLDAQGQDNTSRVNFGVKQLKQALKNLQTNKTIKDVFGEPNISVFDYTKAIKAIDSWYGQNIDLSIPQPPIP